MRILLVLLLLLPVSSFADTYSWEDGEGVHFVDDVSKVPKKYRNKAAKRNEPADAPETATNKKGLVNGTFSREQFEGTLKSKTKFYEDQYGEYYYRKSGVRKRSGGNRGDGDDYHVPVTLYNRKALHALENEVTVRCKGRLDDPTDLGLSREIMLMLRDTFCGTNQTQKKR